MTDGQDDLRLKAPAHPHDVCTETRVEMTYVPLCLTRNTDIVSHTARTPQHQRQLISRSSSIVRFPCCASLASVWSAVASLFWVRTVWTCCQEYLDWLIDFTEIQRTPGLLLVLLLCCSFCSFCNLSCFGARLLSKIGSPNLCACVRDFLPPCVKN